MKPERYKSVTERATELKPEERMSYSLDNETDAALSIISNQLDYLINLIEKQYNQHLLNPVSVHYTPEAREWKS